MSHSEHKATTTLALLVGIGAGIAAGILFAPRSGKETRDQLKKQAEEARAKAKKKLDEERDMLKHKADDVKSKARKLAAEGKHVAEDVVRDVKARADERSEAA